MQDAMGNVSIRKYFLWIFLKRFFVHHNCNLHLPMFLLHLQYAMFDVAMVIFAWLLVVETKGKPVEKMHSEFGSHRIWMKYALVHAAIDEGESNKLELTAKEVDVNNEQAVENEDEV